MQCNQPFGNGYPNYEQRYPYNPPLQCSRPYPEIIGEGDVASVVLPDGNVQFFFTPTANWWTPVAGPPLLNSNNSSWNSNAGIWFVRTISNPLPPVAFNQLSQRNYGVPLLRPRMTSECNIPPHGFNLKFHNDHWTSTTDLQYFYPCLRRDWTPMTQSKGSASVQVELLPLTNTICHQEIICNKPCHCITNTRVKESKRGCECKKLDTSSNMSIEETIPKAKHEENMCKSNDRRKGHSCECHDFTKSNTTDKSVTTYTDQASGCTAENGRETQTCNDTSLVHSAKSVVSCDGKLEKWCPKTPFSKQAMKSQCSYESIHVDDICSDSCSCWSSEHEV